MNDKVTITTLDDFIRRFPEMADLDPMNRRDFDATVVNKEELELLNQYFSSICIDLTLYMQLFNHKNHVMELNKFNGFVFSRLENAYLEKICLKIATLMDPPKCREDENLSLRRFTEKINSPMLQKSFSCLNEFYEKSGIRDWRRKVLAHADLSVLSGKVKIEMNFERVDIDDFIARVQELIDWLVDPRVATDHQAVLPRDTDGFSFIQKIRMQNESGQVQEVCDQLPQSHSVNLSSDEVQRCDKS